MSSVFRLTTVQSRAVSKALRPSMTRSFHSPYVVLGKDASAPTTTSKPSFSYEKATETFEDVPHVGLRTHVVAPNPTGMFYQVPTGAYPASVSFTEHSGTAPEPSASK
ncbi:hypothetical protein K435DRAFT_323256 [Dendrothele bispora CBS 962.96]|uniref:Uncharacterized protein n=1 Tax=Dendrothele bispora (strain CBS 962.96) TaxID=1314807 RepID=A0A4V4HHI7_DENBC|nr:hypothetical protein K435DRAFT_323256 [Dendrothele bispora CBS 962.96]